MITNFIPKSLALVERKKFVSTESSTNHWPDLKPRHSEFPFIWNW